MSAEGLSSRTENQKAEEGGVALKNGARPLRVLGIYPWNRFWSMGEFRGAPSFFLAPQALKRAGHNVFISMPAGGEVALSSGTPGEEDYHGMKLLRYRFGIDFMPMTGHPLYIHLTRPFRYIYYLMIATCAGFRAARRVRPDVLVGYGALAAPVAFVVARSLGLSNVTRLFGQSLSLGLETGLKAKLRFCLNYPEIIAFLTPCSSLIMHNDGSGGDRAAARLGVSQKRLKFWKNGIDRNLFRPPKSRASAKSELGYEDGAPLVLSVSRLDAEKHHERLIHAMPDLVGSIPGVNVVIIGDGPERNYLRSEAARLGVSSSLKLLGSMPRESLVKYYQACDLFVTLSDRTNMSNPTDEAMSCEACVVALDAGDVSGADSVDDSIVIVGRGELSGLGGILVDLLRDDGRRTEMAVRAAQYAMRELPSVEERARMEALAVEAAAAR